MASKGEPHFAYALDEKVLCFHGPQIYEARVKEVRTVVGESGAKEANYFVHYANWNKSWDEWVGESRMMKHNEAGLQRQKELASSKGKGAAGRRKKEGPGDRSKRKRTDKEEGVEGEDEHLAKPEVRVLIPDDLKQKLVEDWDQIIHKNKLVRVPHALPVSKMLADYLAAHKGRTARAEQVAQEVVAGLKVYFEEALGSILLYRFERPQYEQLRRDEPSRPLCELYGPEHLLRLFTKLPMLLAHTHIEERGMSQLLTHLHDILKYMEKNLGTLFAEEYEIASPAYVKAAQV